MKREILAALVFVVALSAGAAAQTASEVGPAYVGEMMARDIVAMEARLAPGVSFDDRMSTRWGGDGWARSDRAGLIALEHQWGDVAWSNRGAWSIADGCFFLTTMILSAPPGPGVGHVEMPFSTLLRVRDGLIVSRHDWGDYSSVIGAEATGAEAGARARVRGVRERVLAGVRAGDAEAVRRELADGVSLDQYGVDGALRAGADPVGALMSVRGVLIDEGAIVRQQIESERCSWTVVSSGEGAGERAVAISLLMTDGRVVEVRVYVLGGRVTVPSVRGGPDPSADS